MTTLAERFWNRVDRSSATGCWPWTGPPGDNRKLKNGEPAQGGRLSVDGHLEHASRVGWQLVYGPIPEGLFVLHHCDNRMCQRPEHWFLGTQAENVADMMAKGRESHTARNIGSQHGMAKLTDEIVREIRLRYAAGERQVDIARRYGTSQTRVSAIVRRVAWKHVA